MRRALLVGMVIGAGLVVSWHLGRWRAHRALRARWDHLDRSSQWSGV